MTLGSWKFGVACTLADLQAQLAAARGENRPRVIPHPTLVRKVLQELLQIAEANQESGRAMLQQYMPPLILTPLEKGKWKLTGGFDIEAVFEVCDPNSRRDRD